MFLDSDGTNRFEAEGAVALYGAKISGDLRCSGASLTNKDGVALNFGNAEIGGDVFLDSDGTNRFEAEGAVMLDGAKIGRDLNCAGARLSAQDGSALSATSANIGGVVFLDTSGEARFTATGCIYLLAVKIGGSLQCSGASLTNKDGVALRFGNAEIGGDVFLNSDGTNRFEAEGAVRLDGAKIGSDLNVVECSLKSKSRTDFALSMRGTQIAGQLYARRNIIKGPVSMSGARVERLADDPDTAWTVDAGIGLDELTYSHVGIADDDKRPLWKARARWLRRNSGKHWGYQNRVSSQPWRECASAFARAGQYGEARRIAREEQREANRSRTWWMRPWIWLFAELPFGYGLSVSRSVITSIVFWALGWGGAELMLARGALVDSKSEAGAVRLCATIEAPLYALDTAIPFLDLRQESACDPGAAPGARLFAGLALPGTAYRIFDEIMLWRWAKVVYAILGALVIGFSVLTYTGVFKPKE